MFVIMGDRCFKCGFVDRCCFGFGYFFGRSLFYRNFFGRRFFSGYLGDSFGWQFDTDFFGGFCTHVQIGIDGSRFEIRTLFYLGSDFFRSRHFTLSSRGFVDINDV